MTILKRLGPVVVLSVLLGALIALLAGAAALATRPRMPSLRH